jgi:hypothetical protein
MSRNPSEPNYGRAVRHLMRAAIEFRDVSREHRDTTGAITAKLLFSLSKALMQPRGSGHTVAPLAAELDEWMAD